MNLDLIRAISRAFILRHGVTPAYSAAHTEQFLTEIEMAMKPKGKGKGGKGKKGC